VNLDHFRRHLVWAEDRRTDLYDDTTGERIVLASGGKITGGVGWNFTDRPLPQSVIDQLLELAMNDAIANASALAYWSRLNDARQLCVADLMYNLGPTRFRRFVKFHSAMEAGDYADAAQELVESKWHEQVGRRAEKLETAMRTGIWAEEHT
jgi:lysozyme